MKVIAHRDQVRETWRPGVETRMHVSAGNGATQLCIFEQWVAQAAGAPTHAHPVEEVLTVISGSEPLHIHAVLASAVFEAMPDGSAEPVRRWLPE